MKKLICIFFLLLLIIQSVWANESVENKIIGDWISSTKENIKVIYIFDVNSKFIWQLKEGKNTFYTEGKYSIQETEGKILIDFQDFSHRDYKNKIIKGLIEFIDNDTFQIDGKCYEKNKKEKREKKGRKINISNYPTEFSKDTLIFKRK